ncbi:MAG: HEAT repeat domain-containing protein, partial [Planctomycetes bacterium]|nr:HEAT repeat domain-containing protein [Planctomycetota bacterium]
MRTPVLAAVLAVLMASGAAGGAAAADSAAPPLSNADIVRLVRADTPTAEILARIGSGPNTFEFSLPALAALDANGVPDTIVNAMRTAALRPSQPTLDETRFRMELANIASGTDESRYEALAWMVANRDHTLPLLRRSLADARPEFRTASLLALGHLRDTDSLPAMRERIADDAPTVRQAAARVLADLNDGQSIAAAELALSRQVNRLDGYARLVGHAKLTRAAGVLGQVLASSPDPAARAAAAWAIGSIGRPGVDGRPALERALAADSDPAVRREAAAALAKFHDERSARLLEDACRKDYEVRRVTLAAMAEYPETV